VAILLLGVTGAVVLTQAGLLPRRLIPSAKLELILLILAIAVPVLLILLRKLAIRQLAQFEKARWVELLQSFTARQWLTILALSLAFVLTFSAQLVILVGGFQPVSAAYGMAAGFMTFFAQSLLPVSIGDLGIRESAAAYFFGKVGIAPHAAFDAALLLFAINMLMPSVAGLVLLWRNKVRPAR